MLDGRIKLDCVNMDEKHRTCVALSKTYCKKEQCRFYKTEKSLSAQLATIRKRIPDYRAKEG